jgi:hypothetical protein
VERERKELVKDDPDDIPMIYLLYVLLAIGAIVAGAAIMVVKMLSDFRTFGHG